MISTAVDQSAVARVTGVKTEFKNIGGPSVFFLPQRVALVGQGSTAATYSTDKVQIASASEAAATFGFGSPIHLAALQLLPLNNDGVGSIPVTVYPLVDDGSGVAATGDITPAGTATKAGSFRVKINNILSAAFSVAIGDNVAAVVTAMTAALAAELNLPVTAADNATDMGVTVKWKGESGNDIVMSVEGPTDTGITFAVTNPSAGAVNPDIDAALAQVGGVWETMVLNCLNIEDTTTLDKYQTFGDGRWTPLVRKPLVVFTGNNKSTVALATAVSDARGTDKVNAQLVSPSATDLPLVIAARQLARIVKVANNNPPHDYGSQDATGLTPAADGLQWDYPQRDQAVKAGSSTIEVKDSVVNISDVVTFYHPVGDPLPAYRYVVDIVKLQNVIFNIDLVFNSKRWDGKPLIPNDQVTTNPEARKPKTARADIGGVLDGLGLAAIISDPATAKANTLVDINAQNPKRLDAKIPVQLSGNTNIKSVDLDFGFFFGAQPVA